MKKDAPRRTTFLSLFTRCPLLSPTKLSTVFVRSYEIASSSDRNNNDFPRVSSTNAKISDMNRIFRITFRNSLGGAYSRYGCTLYFDYVTNSCYTSTNYPGNLRITSSCEVQSTTVVSITLAQKRAMKINIGKTKNVA